MYICIQKGVYRHLIVGASEDLEKARVYAKAAIEKEHDHYHDVEIVKVLAGTSAWEAEGDIVETWTSTSVPNGIKYAEAGYGWRTLISVHLLK